MRDAEELFLFIQYFKLLDRVNSQNMCMYNLRVLDIVRNGMPYIRNLVENK